MNTTVTYQALGASSTKEDVHQAISILPSGIYPGAFCHVIADIAGSAAHCSIVHADGAGTKSIVAYFAYKETGDAQVFEGIAQDSVVMNLDDVACVGATSNFALSSTIGRNSGRIGVDVLSALMKGQLDLSQSLEPYGIAVTLAGGETADVGDLVGTIIVDSTIVARMPRDEIIDCSNISAGDYIVGVSSSGQTPWQTRENSGIGSNGFTLARHILLSNEYARKYPETVSTDLNEQLTYQGAYLLDDSPPGLGMTVGEALLSPTRTYLPVLSTVYEKYREQISGVIHCTGGGLVKSRSFGRALRFIKREPLPVPPIFQLIYESGRVEAKEMYRSFNNGQRLEIYCKKEIADNLTALINSCGVAAKIIGEVTAAPSDENEVVISGAYGEATY